MSQSAIRESYSGMPPWGKAVVFIGVLAILTIGGLTAYKLIKKGQDDKKDQDVEDKINSVSDAGLQALSTRQVYPTFLSEQYLSWANQLHECFNGMGTCTSYMEMFRQLNNDADWLRLVQAYGVRTISSGKFNFWENDKKLDLGSSLVSELSSYNLDEINSLFAKKGMKKWL